MRERRILALLQLGQFIRNLPEPLKFSGFIYLLPSFGRISIPSNTCFHFAGAMFCADRHVEHDFLRDVELVN